VEYPHGVCGTFEERFLELPDDILITAMREHQKYFCVTDADGRLLANFVAVNNTRVPDEKLAAEGHQRVLRARLEDAVFFFKDDRNRKLADRVHDLSGLIFQAKLLCLRKLKGLPS
jgi:glycyl-tRNA synthetase beta chain